MNKNIECGERLVTAPEPPSLVLTLHQAGYSHCKKGWFKASEPQWRAGQGAALVEMAAAG